MIHFHAHDSIGDKNVFSLILAGVEEGKYVQVHRRFEIVINFNHCSLYLHEHERDKIFFYICHKKSSKL